MTMKLLLKASVCLVALCYSETARALVCANCTEEIGEIAREVARAAQVVEQINKAKEQLQEATKTYDQLVSTYQAIAHAPDSVLQDLGAQFNVQQLRNPLPTTPGAIGNLIGGTGMGSLNGSGQQYLNQNRVYAPAGSDYNSSAMTTNANSIAGVQSITDQLYQSAAAHRNALQGLESQLANAPDEKAVADISARIQLEQTHIAASQVQAASINTWQQAQVRSTEQQLEESRRCHIDVVLAKLTNGTQDVPAADPCTQPGNAYGSGGGSGGGAGAGGSGSGSVASNYGQYLGQSVGSGQCVALVQAADSNVGLTRTWTQGAQVMGNTSIQPGTAIATFDGSGHYANAMDGSSHAAIYLGQNAQGMQVEDQWSGHAASTRTIPWSNTSGAANTGSAFHVISH